MKKMIALTLVLCLCAGLAMPAFAETASVDMESALAEVTAQVKETLRVDDDYTDFYGDYYDELVSMWSLNWSDENRNLSVSCDEDGKILDVYAYTYTEDNDNFYGFDPVFPALSAEEARAQAEDWLSRFMGEGETARIDSQSSSLGSGGSYRYYGVILLNGLDSPITFSIRMDANGLRSYSRSDGYSPYVGEVPSAEAESGRLSAAVHLASAVDMELYYVMDEATGEARLRYVPMGPYTVVDAQTGDVVDMEELYASFEKNGYSMAMEAGESDAVAASGALRNAGGLTEMELSSISNYGDVLSQKDIDTRLRLIDTLGLTDDFELVRCSYSMNSTTGDVTASLRYTAPMTEKELYGFSKDEFKEYEEWGESLTIYKYITVNAKTGALVSVSTSYPLWEKDEKSAKRDSVLAKNAESFLDLCAEEMYADTALCTLSLFENREGMTYARRENGYFFPENYLYVEMNSATATVDEFRYVWDDDVEFASSWGIVSAADGAAAYVDALEVTLGYVAWPEEIREDEPELLRYAEWGYTWVESLRLAYYFDGLDDVSGVDALTGEVLKSEQGEEGTFVYSDVSSSEAREAIEALAQAGIGFDGGQFLPNNILTQREAVMLLLQSAGSSPADWDDERLCSAAVEQGFITSAEWSPASSVSRMGFLKMMLNASRYGDAAALTGVWTCDFTDVSDEDMAYGALAQALGLASGDQLDPSGVCTRAMAAEFLYAFMSR